MKSSELRWGQSSPAGAVEARSRLLDAAERCFERDGLSSATMEAVAAEASVSRATLYRYYSGREELILDAVLREADRFYAKIRPRIDGAETLEAAILDFTVLMIRAARKDQFLSVLFSVDGAQHAGRMVSEGSVALFERVALFLQPTFERFSDELRSDLVPDDAAEWILRSVFSFFVVPGPKRRSREALGAYLQEYLIPSLKESQVGSQA